MKCNQVQKKMSAYLDNELTDKESRSIAEHLNQCPDCQKEYNLLDSQEKYLATLTQVEPSTNFRTKFWSRAKLNEQTEKLNIPKRIVSWDWFPIPVMSLLVTIIIFASVTFSVNVYAKGKEVKQQIVSCAIKNFVVNYHPLSPVTILNFCEDCCQTLCDCAQEQGVTTKCMCSRCEK